MNAARSPSLPPLVLRVLLLIHVACPLQEIKIDTTVQDIKDGKEGLPPLRNPPLLETADDLATLSHLNEPSGPWSFLYSTLTIYRSLTPLRSPSYHPQSLRTTQHLHLLRYRPHRCQPLPTRRPLWPRSHPSIQWPSERRARAPLVRHRGGRLHRHEQRWHRPDYHRFRREVRVTECCRDTRVLSPCSGAGKTESVSVMLHEHPCRRSFAGRPSSSCVTSRPSTLQTRRQEQGRRRPWTSPVRSSGRSSRPIPCSRRSVTLRPPVTITRRVSESTSRFVAYFS